MGYYLAGFINITGVDIKPMPRYPFRFVRSDALEYLAAHGHEYDFIHASPPCQHYSVMTNGRWKDRVNDHPDMIADVRTALINTGKPYIIENVGGARGELINPIMLCGTMFGLQTEQGNQLIRHRYFECSFGYWLVPPCAHNNGSAVGVYGGGQNPSRRRLAVGVYGHTGGSSKRDALQMFDVNARRKVMGIPWMTGKELSEAIPPAYTNYLGRHFLEQAGYL